MPVPLYPPVRLGRMDEYAASRPAGMLAVSGARLVVSRGGVRRLLGDGARASAARSSAASTRTSCAPGRRPARRAEPSPDDLALVQFSSGSTVDPKPVALTHAALAAQSDALVAADRARGRDDVLVSWLPLYHDMGLIGALLGAMSYPGPLVLLPPEHFLARPALWLRAMARHRGTISAAPSFAYALRRRPGEGRGARGRCPSRRWRLALDGAEPVSPEAMRRFAGALRAASASTRARSCRSTASPRRRSR